MKQKYAVQFRGVQGQVVLTYDDKNRLEQVDMSELYEQEDHRNWMWDWFPQTTTMLLDKRMKNDNRIQITAIHEDLSFERFWEEYGYKVGKKKRAQNLWDLLPNTDKSLCLDAIKKYKYWLAHKPNIETLYPSTFLSQRRFENEFKVKK